MSLARGLTVQLEVLHALILRETRTRFGAHQLGYAWALVEPLLWIGTLYFVFELNGVMPPSGMNLVTFLATGIVPYQLFRESCTRVTVATNSNKGLLFYPQVRPLDLIVSRVLLETATSISVFALIIAGHAFVRGTFVIDGLLSVLLGFALASALGGGLGAILCSTTIYTTTVERFAGPVLRPLFWVSGVFYTANDLPPPVLRLLAYNPLLHVIELVRDGFFTSYRSRVAEPLYVVAWVLVLWFFALAFERVSRRHIEVS